MNGHFEIFPKMNNEDVQSDWYNKLREQCGSERDYITGR